MLAGRHGALGFRDCLRRVFACTHARAGPASVPLFSPRSALTRIATHASRTGIGSLRRRGSVHIRPPCIDRGRDVRWAVATLRLETIVRTAR